MVVVVGDEDVARAGVDGDPLRVVEAAVIRLVGARARRAVAERPPAQRRGGHCDDVPRPRAGRQHRVPGIARGVLVQAEGLDAVVVLVGDIGHRGIGRGGLSDGEPARAGVVAQRNCPAPWPVVPHAASQRPVPASKTCTRSFSESST